MGVRNRTGGELRAFQRGRIVQFEMALCRFEAIRLGEESRVEPDVRGADAGVAGAAPMVAGDELRDDSTAAHSWT